MKTVTLYVLFAALSIVANLAAQAITFRCYSGQFSLVISMATGTLVGLVLKYILDKKFIFNFKSRSLIHDGGKFILYTIMGLLTTLLFWAVEFGFVYLFENESMKYVGATLGLVIGYTVKYNLDKRYVFQN
nr:GtrA family protein [uncultured Cohaesibacter sp.]